MTTYTIEVTETNKPKSGYQPRYSKLQPTQATLYWAGMNIGRGFKARLRDDKTGKIVRRKA
jgi:hypothetical protein